MHWPRVWGDEDTCWIIWLGVHPGPFDDALTFALQARTATQWGGVQRLLCLSVPPRLCSMLASVDCGLLCSPLLLVWSRNGDVILQSNPVIILRKHLLLTLLTRLCPSSYRGILHHFVGFLQEAKHHWIYCRCIIQSITLNYQFNPMKFTLKLGFNDIKMYYDHSESFWNEFRYSQHINHNVFRIDSFIASNRPN